MGGRGNCHDTVVDKSFFPRPKREGMRRRTYLTRVAARQDVFDRIGIFANPKQKQTNNGMLLPVDCETSPQKQIEADV